MTELEELLAQLDRLAELTDEELAELLEGLATHAEALAEGDVTDEVLETLERVAQANSQVLAEQERRVEEAAQQEREQQERAARAQELLQQVRGSEPDPEGGGDGDPEAQPDGDTPAPEADGDTPAPEAETPEAVAAAAGRSTTPRVSRVNARRPAAVRPRPAPATQVAITAAANVPGITAGTRLDTDEQLGQAFFAAFQAGVGYQGGRSSVPVVTLRAEYPEERQLGRDPVTNAERIAAVTSLDALTAAGGICAPPEVRYDLPVLGTDARPVRDQAMARFGATRGGVRTMPPPRLTDLDGAIGEWTNATDTTTPTGTTKPCLVVTCPDEDETLITALTRCIRFGNFRARFFGEQIRAWTDLAATNHARRAETRLLNTIGAGSTQVTAPAVLSATRDVLANLDRATAAFRSRHRTLRNYPLRFVAPFWLLDLMRTDLARELPGSTDERLAMADAEIETLFRARNVNVTWTLDGEAGQVFGAQADGALLAFPGTVITYLYPEGSWLFLDGGTLDLGLVRDSTLNDTNDAEMFMETFEAGHFHGIESFRIAMTLCPSGATSGTTDIVCA